MARRATDKRSQASIGGEIRSELRNILHNLCELLRPINRFVVSPTRPLNEPRYFVCFDSAPNHEITGFRAHFDQLRLPVESISNNVALLAASVWHLKDRLNHIARWNGSIDVNAWTDGNRNLQICGDIGNQKKHGHHQNFSEMSPQLVPEIIFDTSQNGVQELYYNGATKLRVLLVSNPVPIPYRIDIADGGGTVIGSAAEIIRAGFDHWIPLIEQLGILAGSGTEETALRQILLPGRPETGSTP